MLFEFDKKYLGKYSVICGVDEAGRGPLAGDVFAAAVILSDTEIDGLNDSKKLTEKKRESLYDDIIKHAVAYSIKSASVAEIEKLNILGAALLAMKRAVESLSVTPDIALIDGNKKPKIDICSETIIKGDGISACIAAASILAKVSRDRYMLEMAKKFPHYGFEKHKGYGTKLHYEKIAEYGSCELHRQSFLKKLH